MRVLSKEINQNKLHISKILYGVKRDNSKDLDNTDSTAGPGFGRSSVCNVNVICYSPWANESRAVAEIGDGHGGWFTGALVMNTCNTNRPYILTAWHCVVQSGGTFVPSTFEFLWISPTCATTTNTTQTILFNGSSIAALWEQTDFALVVLDQNIPQNSGLSFLGWSRSTTIPVGAVGIHHPKGDIMKISMDNDAALVGNIKTYLNKAWRVQWDIGIVQDGSSGSPLFNLDHKLIGQLYSSSQPEDPPCNQPIGGANYGRFDQSWEGGGTPNTRLKDWLDPSNSGAMTTNTTNVSALTVFPSAIYGDDIFCTTSNNYTIPNLPPGATVHWEVFPQGIVTVNSPNSLQTTLTKITNGEVQLTATISSCANLSILSIKVGPQPVQSLTIDGVDPTSTIVCHNTESMLVAFPGVIDQNATYTWYLPDSWVSTENGTNTVTTQDYMTSVYPGGDGTIYVRRLTQCGYSDFYSVFVQFDPWCGNYYIISPNPATDNITIDGQKQKRNIKEVQIIDKTGQVRKLVKFGNNVQRVNVNISELASGVYYIKIFDGKEWRSKPIIIN